MLIVLHHMWTKAQSAEANCSKLLAQSAEVSKLYQIRLMCLVI